MATIISRLQEAVQSIIQGTLDTAKASPVTTALIVVPSLYLFIKSLPRFLSRGKVQLYHSSPSLTIPLRSGSTTTLASIIEPLLPPCNLNPLLFNGDLQTIAVQATSHGVPIHYKRRIFEGDDPIYSGTFAVDFVVPPASTPSETQSNAAATKTDNLPPRTTYFTAPQWQTLSTGSSDTRPMLIILHGLSGGSHEVYLRAFLDPLVPSDTHPTRDSGWEACVLIARGCSRTRVTSPILYNARATWDLRQLVKFLRLKYPNRPLFAAGFSLGGNILVNYLGEEGEKCEIQAAVVFSSVWNMEVAARALQRSWFKMEVYNRALGSSMKKLFRRHEEMITKVKGIDREEVLGLRYLFEFVSCFSSSLPYADIYTPSSHPRYVLTVPSKRTATSNAQPGAIPQKQPTTATPPPSTL